MFQRTVFCNMKIMKRLSVSNVGNIVGEGCSLTVFILFWTWLKERYGNSVSRFGVCGRGNYCFG
jgi:hypothetical protein